MPLELFPGCSAAQSEPPVQGHAASYGLMAHQSLGKVTNPNQICRQTGAKLVI